MNIIQCSFCKKPFQTLGRKICPECIEQMEKDFFVVRDYIYEHKQTNMDIVSEETGVSKRAIMHLLKEGRLEIEDKSGGGDGLFKCDKCKKPINSGRLCSACKDKVANAMQKSADFAKAAHAAKAKSDEDFKSGAKLR